MSGPVLLANHLCSFIILVTIFNLLLLSSTNEDNHSRSKNLNFNNNNGLNYNIKLNNEVFMQFPSSNPPTVRPPPYSNSKDHCPEINERENWVNTLCGDLNKGVIPINPLGHEFWDESNYPFDLIKNETLKFFRHALPVLKNEESLPKVARFNPYEHHSISQFNDRKSRTKRGIIMENLDDQRTNFRDSMFSEEISNEGRSMGNMRYRRHHHGANNAQNRFCENSSNFQSSGSLICKLYHAMWGKNQTPNRHQGTRDGDHLDEQMIQSPTSYTNSNHHGAFNSRHRGQEDNLKINRETLMSEGSEHNVNSKPLPTTPCPSSAEYLTPVFARNHEGAWRYVVQIPKEGYFTQTVEVTKCGESKCFFMDGSCRTSPRWQSLLVAEMFYPDTQFPVVGGRERRVSVDKLKLKEVSKRSGKTSGSLVDENNISSQLPPECDGVDKIGCFQIRLFYDWFLIPGSCKCWRAPFDFTKVHQSK